MDIDLLCQVRATIVKKGEFQDVLELTLCNEFPSTFIRTMQIFNFYGLCRIGYGYIDYFLIRIKDLIGFLGAQGLDIREWSFITGRGDWEKSV